MNAVQHQERTERDITERKRSEGQPFATLEYSSKRPRLRNRDRIFWVWLSKCRSNWRSVLLIVQPQTVVHWHKQGFKLYWR